MQNLDVSKTVDAWSSLADTVFVPHTEAEYQSLVTLLDRLIDEVGENESHPLASLMEGWRNLLVRNQLPGFDLWPSVLTTAIVLALGVWIFAKLRPTFADYL